MPLSVTHIHVSILGALVGYTRPLACSSSRYHRARGRLTPMTTTRRLASFVTARFVLLRPKRRMRRSTSWEIDVGSRCLDRLRRRVRSASLSVIEGRDRGLITYTDFPTEDVALTYADWMYACFSSCTVYAAPANCCILIRSSNLNKLTRADHRESLLVDPCRLRYSKTTQFSYYT